MKTISAAFLTTLQGENPPLAYLCKIARKDGTVSALTDHDAVITFIGVRYTPIGPDVVSIIRATATMEADSADLKVAYLTGILEKQDILARLFDGATVASWLVNFNDLSQYVRLPTCLIGETTARDHDAVLEILGLTQKLNVEIGEITSPGCRAELGDSRCKIDLNFYTEHGIVLDVTGRYEFAAELKERHALIDHKALWQVSATTGELTDATNGIIGVASTKKFTCATTDFFSSLEVGHEIVGSLFDKSGNNRTFTVVSIDEDKKGIEVAQAVVDETANKSAKFTWGEPGSNWFTKGRVIWDKDLVETFNYAGVGEDLNDGLEMEVQQFSYETWTGIGVVPIFTLTQSMPFAIQPGDKFRAIAGCLKSRDACKSKFGNVDNLRCEPDVPGNDKAREYADIQ